MVCFTIGTEKHWHVPGLGAYRFGGVCFPERLGRVCFLAQRGPECIDLDCVLRRDDSVRISAWVGAGGVGLVSRVGMIRQGQGCVMVREGQIWGGQACVLIGYGLCRGMFWIVSVCPLTVVKNTKKVVR